MYVEVIKLFSDQDKIQHFSIKCSCVWTDCLKNALSLVGWLCFEPGKEREISLVVVFSSEAVCCFALALSFINVHKDESTIEVSVSLLK